MDDPRVLAPCGTNCSVCPYLMAYKDEDDRLKEKLAKSVRIKPEQVACEGCNSEIPLFFCNQCQIKRCVQKEGKASCVECEKYPCENIERYPFKPFLQRLKWDVNYQKQFGKEAWIKKTIEINSCSKCNTLNHWKASRCKSCGSELEERY